MKKFILPLVLFIAILFFPSASFAQYSPDCWNTHMVKQMSVCSKASLECNQKCSYIKDSGARKTCFGECSAAAGVCRSKASVDYKACVEASRRSNQVSLFPSPQSVTAAPINTPVIESTLPFSFIEIPIDDEPPTFVGIVGFDTVIHTPDDKQFSDVVSKDIINELLNRKPAITIEDEKKAWQFEPEFISQEPGEKIKVFDSSDSKFKSPLSSKWTSLEEVSFLPDGSTVSGPWLRLKLDVGLTVTEKVSAVLSLNNFQAKINSNSVDLQKGEIEFKSLGDIETHPVFTVKTDNAEITTKDTHFWVFYDKNKKYTLIGVYEGQVEVKTNDGQTTTVSPSGDKPGVVVVSQKLSIVKLILVGLGLIAIVFGAVLVLKRRGNKIIKVKKKK